MDKQNDIDALILLCETYFTSDELVAAKGIIQRLADGAYE